MRKQIISYEQALSDNRRGKANFTGRTLQQSLAQAGQPSGPNGWAEGKE